MDRDIIFRRRIKDIFFYEITSHNFLTPSPLSLRDLQDVMLIYRYEQSILQCEWAWQVHVFMFTLHWQCLLLQKMAKKKKKRLINVFETPSLSLMRRYLIEENVFNSERLLSPICVKLEHQRTIYSTQKLFEKFIMHIITISVWFTPCDNIPIQYSSCVKFKM